MLRYIKKIVLSIFIMFISFIVVNGAVDNRVLTCDANDQKYDKFIFSEKKVLDNSVCTIKCSEELFYGIDPIKKVLAGRGFNYPLFISGEKKCTAEYKYTEYNTELKRLVGLRNATSDTTLKATYANQITNILLEKEECDKYYEKGQKGEYKLNANVKLEVETSNKTEQTEYKFVPISSVDVTTDIEEVPYQHCSLLNGYSNCNMHDTTVKGWTSIDRKDGVYTVGERYMELYTGKIKLTSSDPNDCKICNAHFVSYFELTRPLKGDNIDKGYPLTITANNIGNNVDVTDDHWNVTVNCWYQVENVLFPQSGDINNYKYGETGFMYRLIDLSDPFPEREEGYNWINKRELINTNIKQRVAYEINLTRSAIRAIKLDNKENPGAYSIFDYDINGRNTFVEKHISIITRK